MNSLKKWIKPIIGFILFYGVQYAVTPIFYNILIQKNSFINQAIYIGSELLLLGLLILLNLKRLQEDKEDFNKNYKSYLKTGITYLIIGGIAMVATNLLINVFFTTGISENEALNRQIMTVYPIYFVVATILTGPFIEELVFRINFKDTLKNKYLYVGVTSLLFAFAHIISSLDEPYGYLFLIPYECLSLVFSLIAYKTNNVYTSIILHVIHNTLTIIMLVTLLTSGVYNI